MSSKLERRQAASRRSYGLSDEPDRDRKPFHLTFGVRRAGVLRRGAEAVKGG